MNGLLHLLIGIIWLLCAFAAGEANQWAFTTTLVGTEALLYLDFGGLIAVFVWPKWVPVWWRIIIAWLPMIFSSRAAQWVQGSHNKN